MPIDERLAWAMSSNVVVFAVPVAIVLALAVRAWMFWLGAAAWVWIVSPGSAAANTYFYLWMCVQESSP